MKILIATQHRSIVGGVETYLQAVIPALLESGHEVALLCDYAPADPGAPTVDPPDARLPVWYAEELRSGSRQWQELSGWGPEIVYSHGIASLEINQFLQQTYPTVLYLHGYWGTCTTGRKCHAFPVLQTCTRKFGPACLLLHYPRRCGGLNPLLAWQMFQTERARNAQLAEYRSILVASTHMYAEMQRHGVSSDRLQLLRLPLNDFSGSSPAGPKTPDGRLLFVGRLTDVKGVDFLIRALPRAEKKLGRKLTLTIAGDGSELSKLQQLTAREGIAATFTGWVDNARRRELMRGADLLVVPSLWPEPFGLVGIEAGNLGLPAAGFAAGGIPDWLIAGRTGELAPADPPTVEGLADAIARSLANPDHYASLCQGAFEFSRQFTLEKHTAELEAILSSCAVASSRAVASKTLIAPEVSSSNRGR